MRKARLIVSVLGSLWFFLLYSTPYILVNPQEVPPLNGAYAYASVGVLTGLILSEVARRYVPAKPFAQFGCILFAGGFPCCFVLSLPEFFFYQASALSGLEWDPSNLASIPVIGALASDYVEWLSFSELRHTALLLGNGIFASFSLSAMTSVIAEHGDWGSSEDNDDNGQRLDRFVALLGIVILLLGFARPGMWSAFACAAVDSEWLGDAPKLAEALPSFICVFLAIVLCTIAWNLATSLRGVARAENLRDLRWLVASFPLGQLLWNLISRCTEVPVLFSKLAGFEKLAVIVLLFIAICLVVCEAGNVSRQRSCLPKNTPHKAVEVCDETLVKGMSKRKLKGTGVDRELIGQFLQDMGLTQREQQAVSLMLEGRTSKEAAEELGLKPPTVRNYLQRGYKKIGVQNASELKARLKDEAGERLSCQHESDLDDFCANSKAMATESLIGMTTKHDEKACANQRLLEVELFLQVFVSVMLAAYFYLKVNSWIAVHSASLGLSVGLLFTGVVLCLNAEFRFASEAVFRRLSMVVSTLSFSFFSVVLSLLMVWPSISQHSLIAPLLTCICIAGCVFAGLISVLFQIRQSEERHSEREVALTAIAIVVGTIAACVPEFLWLLLCFASLLGLTSVSLITIHRVQVNPIVSDALEAGGNLFTVIAATGFSFGVVMEEVLRGASDVFALTVQIVFFVVAIAIVVWRRSELEGWSRPAVFISISFAIVAVITSLEYALLLCSILLLVFRRGCQFDRRLHSCAAVSGLGCGVAVGCLIIDKWHDLLQINVIAMAEYGGEIPVYIAIPAIVVLIAAVGLLTFWHVISIEEIPQDNNLSVDRAKLFLQSRGVSESECAVLSLIASGLTGTQIAHETHYSYGAVNTMRASGYKKLGVHSKTELIELIEKNIA